MRSFRALGLATLGLMLASGAAQAQQRWDDSFKWYLGGQAGVLGFSTQTQGRAWVPTVGGQLNIVAKRAGLLFSVDEAFGSDETTGYTDVNAANNVRDVSFNHIRKYSAILTAYPVRGQTQPYFGLGFGLIQVISPAPGGFFNSPAEANLAQKLANDKSADGFISVVGGVQFRLGRTVGFGQYQLASAPKAGRLLRGATHALTGGLRFSLGSSKEGIRGGGY